MTIVLEYILTGWVLVLAYAVIRLSERVKILEDATMNAEIRG